MDFFTRLMSGTDNQTPAIGRYLGALLFLVFLWILPVVVLIAMWVQGVKWDIYRELFTALTLYVPAIVGSVIALIWGTHSTEPKPGGPGV